MHSTQIALVLLVEQQAMRHFLEYTRQSNHAEESFQMSFAEIVLKRIRTEQTSMQIMYIGLLFLLRTLVTCEHLFSVAGFALINRRHRLLPAYLECQIYLYVSSNQWRILDVRKMIEMCLKAWSFVIHYFLRWFKNSFSVPINLKYFFANTLQKLIFEKKRFF